MVGSVGNSSPRFSIEANANSSVQRHAEMFSKMDTNGDGKIDESELEAVVHGGKHGKDAASIMKAADTNGDGSIDKAESDSYMSSMETQRKGKMPPAGPPRPRGPKRPDSDSSPENTGEIFDKLDTNKDGKVSMQELLAAAGDPTDGTEVQDLFKSIDTNSDGSISKSDLDAFLTKLEKELDDLHRSFQSYNKDGDGAAGGLGYNVDSVA